MSVEVQQIASRFVGELIRLGATRDKIPASRAALAKLRQSVQNPIMAAPYVAPFTQQLNPKQEEAFYLVASLFALNPEHQSRISFGEAFRYLREKSDSMEKRFNMVVAARSEQLPDLLRHGIRLFSGAGIALDWELLLLDIFRWDDIHNTVQRKWARDFYRNSNTINNDNDEGAE